MKKIVSAVIIVFFFMASAMAQSENGIYNPYSVEIGENIVNGMRVTPRIDTPIRVTPPSGFLQIPGDQVHTATPGQDFIVTNQYQTQNWFRRDQWVEIAPVKPDGEVDYGNSGWSYWGKSTSPVSPNFSAQLN